MIITNNAEMARGKLVVFVKEGYVPITVCVPRSYDVNNILHRRELTADIENILPETQRREPMIPGLSPAQNGYCWDNYEVYDSKQRIVIDKIMANPEAWFVFSGHSGTGKGHIAACIARDKFKEGKSFIYVTALQMLTDLTKDFLNEAKTREYYANTQLLIVDEFDKAGTMTEGKASVFFDVINTRIENDRQVILITNKKWKEFSDLFPGDLKAKYAEAIVSRFDRGEGGTGGNVLKFDWPAWVPKQKKIGDMSPEVPF